MEDIDLDLAAAAFTNHVRSAPLPPLRSNAAHDSSSEHEVLLPPPVPIQKMPRLRTSQIQQVATQLARCDSLQQLPRDLLAEIAEQFLESPVWHLCQLGEASPQLGEIFMDDSLWQKAFQDRFRGASGSPQRRSQSRSPSPSARLSYAQFHLLEMRFRGGMYSAKTTLDNPHRGVAVLDLRIAPSTTSTTAFAALRNGTVMVYDLTPDGFQNDAGSMVSDIATNLTASTRAVPLHELTPAIAGGPALCCLPVDAVQGSCPWLFVGYAQGHLGAWNASTRRPIAAPSWENAHAGRVSALAVAESTLLSASSDSVVKSWDVNPERFGAPIASHFGHAASVVSLASSPLNPHVFLTGSHDRTVKLWDLRRNGDAVVRLQQSDWVTCVDFHPTEAGQLFSSDKRVHLWDLRRPSDHPISSSHQHRKLISKFRADPLRLASCSLDGSVMVSSLEAPDQQRASPHASPVTSPVHRPSPPPGAMAPARELPGTEFGLTEVSTVRTSSDLVLCIDFDATRLLAGGVDGSVDVYDFSDRANFARKRVSLPRMLSLPWRGQADDRSSGMLSNRCT